MLRIVQPHNIPIVLQVAGDEPEWTSPLWVVETLLQEFSCIKAIQVVEWRCAYYTRFGGDLDMAIPPNLRYLGEVLKLCVASSESIVERSLRDCERWLRRLGQSRGPAPIHFDRPVPAHEWVERTAELAKWQARVEVAWESETITTMKTTTTETAQGDLRMPEKLGNTETAE